MNEQKIYSKLQEIADQAYVLTLSHRQDRHIHINTELSDIGYDYDDNWLETVYTTTFPYNDIIIDAINKSGRGHFTKPNEFDCARNHYKIIKTAYDLGYGSVLVMEDDIMFYRNGDYFISALNEIPSNYDIVLFGGFTTDPKILDVIKSNKLNNFWYKNEDIGIWNTSMYLLSRKGMEYYISFMDKFLWVADGPFYKAPENKHIVNMYIPTIPLVIQCDKNEVMSDIRNKNNDNIDYSSQNLYEKYVDINDYTSKK